jgi:hypothetical protein
VTEDINSFMKRIYVNTPEGICLVWKSEKDKKNLRLKAKPERWDLVTLKSCLDYLREKNNG